MGHVGSKEPKEPIKPTLPEHVPPGLGCQRRAAGHCEPNGSGRWPATSRNQKNVGFTSTVLFAKKMTVRPPQFLL